MSICNKIKFSFERLVHFKTMIESITIGASNLLFSDEFSIDEMQREYKKINNFEQYLRDLVLKMDILLYATELQTKQLLKFEPIMQQLLNFNCTIPQIAIFIEEYKVILCSIIKLLNEIKTDIKKQEELGQYVNNLNLALEINYQKKV